MTTHEIGRTINEHIFEIRYKPNAKILDHRGVWAESLSKHLELSEWLIVENRVDVHDKENKLRVFVGFSNAGCVCFTSPTATFFPDKVVKFFRFVLGFDGFINPLFVQRIGIRSKFCTSFGGSFDELRDRYASRYLVPTKELITAYEAKLIDIGGPLNFADKHGNFNTMSGPMPKDQIKEFFSQKTDFPEVGFYFDIDYWLKPNAVMEDKEIVNKISIFSREAWSKHEKIKTLILTK
ncbi:MAG TPA: hypothetical protein VGA95_07285 [Thermodesulfobacteriota bacterium]|jgi:hypothetical protein